MTHDERISSYIDNELSADQEQEFLISLAASDGLRKSFRSELVLKQVLHRDESAVNPPHTLRRSVFAALGLTGAEMLASQHANAATQAAAPHAASHAIKAFFATKMSALITAAGLGVSAMAGYGLHSIVNVPVSVAAHPSVVQPTALQSSQSVAPLASSPIQHELAAPSPQVSDHHQRVATVAHPRHPQVHLANVPKIATDPVSGAAGGGPILMEPPKIAPKQEPQH